MTGRATFGDFALVATRHLQDPQPRTAKLHGRDDLVAATAEAAFGVRAVLHALSGYASDAASVLETVGVSQDRSFGAWVRAAGLARDAFATADTSWPADAAEVAEPEYDRKAGRQERGLRAAAWAMTLGRDLLHTHLDPQPGGRPSDWTPVVTSPPVACALLHQVGRWARQIAPYAGHVAITGRGLTSAERRGLYAACRALWMASWAVGTAQERRPVRKDELQLLAAIPVAGTPRAGLPGQADLVPVLCHGLIRTAERLRAAARRAVPVATWSPGFTRESMRQSAACCAVTASSLRILLRTLAEHEDACTGPISASLARTSTRTNSPSVLLSRARVLGAEDGS